MQGNPVSRLGPRSSALGFRREIILPTHKVNLDGLIRRENFESCAESALGKEPLFKVEELAKGRLYESVLRKPDFQRQTNNWTPEMIVDFVKSFLDDKLIPSIIIWHSKQTNNVFIIDGAHRISALIAWVNDDYGDGPISRERIGDITPAQVKFHKATKKLMDDEVGDYARLYQIALNPQGQDPEKVRRGKAITTSQLSLQKVDGDAKIAEESFLKINSNPAIIDKTELALIRARRKPNAIAVRAIISRGSGQTQWTANAQRSKEIGEAAKRAYDLIFGPIHEISSNSPDIPRAGQPYSQEAFQMVLDMVNIFNDVTPAMWQHTEKAKSRRGTAVDPLADDLDGTNTLKFINRIEDIGQLVADNDRGAFGFDPAVYYYGATGKVVPAALLASLKFAQEINRSKNTKNDFTSARKGFEEFLVRHKSFINDLNSSKGSRTRPLESILAMYQIVLNAMIDGTTSDAAIVQLLSNDERLKESLKVVAPAEEEDDAAASKGKKRFSKTAQNVAVIRDTLSARARCSICGSRLPPHARSKDHIVRVEDGGSGHSDNLQFTHPYCNSGYKESLNSKMSKTNAVK